MPHHTYSKLEDEADQMLLRLLSRVLLKWILLKPMVWQENIALEPFQIYSLLFNPDALMVPQNKYYNLRIKITEVILITKWWYMSCKVYWRRLKMNENGTYRCPECTEAAP